SENRAESGSGDDDGSPNGIGLVEGYPGCGKTFTFGVMGILFLLSGFDVLYSAPTHPAVDQLMRQLAVLIAVTPQLKDVKPIRVHRSMHEKSALYSRAQPDRDVSKVLDTSEDKKEGVSADNDLPMLAAISAKKREAHKRGYKSDDWSLQNQTMEHALKLYQDGVKLLFRYSDPEESEQEITYAEDTGKKQIDAKQPSGELGDMCGALLDFDNKLKSTPLVEWTREERLQYQTAYDRCMVDLVKGSEQHPTVLGSTSNNIAGDDIRPYFGARGKGVIVLSDELSMMREPETWAFIKLFYAHKVAAAVFGGDHKQLPPVVPSFTANPKTNEFTPQIGTTYIIRAFRQKAKTVKLVKCYRMNPKIMVIPNWYTYNGLIIANTTYNKHRINEEFAVVLREHTRVRKNTDITV
ncbi:MAG: hypothetical protein Q9164_007257, partial [Protoblastenia rupestris]